MSGTGTVPPLPGLRIGEWLFEEERHALRRGREERRIEPKAAAVLARLAAEPGRVVAREELLAAGWPALYVGEEVLANAIYQLRRALGDAARSPRYIETIPRRGYRLLAPVAAASRPSTRTSPLPAPVEPTRRRFTLAAALLALLAAAGGLGVGMRVAVGPAARKEAALEAHRLASRGWRELDGATADGATRAAVWAEMALARDPGSASALALEASALARRAAAGELPAAEGFAQARAAADRALRRAPDHPDALRARAVARWLGSWDWAGAERDLRAAIGAAPADDRTRTTLVELLLLAGRAVEADEELATALRLAPRSPRVRLAAATAATLRGRPDEARRHLRAGLAASPGHPELRRQLAKLEGGPGAPAVHPPAATGAERVAAKPRPRPGHLALLYAESGDAARALAWLERAVAQHDPTVLFFRFDPRWDALRGHPRYRRAMQGVESAS